MPPMTPAPTPARSGVFVSRAGSQRVPLGETSPTDAPATTTGTPVFAPHGQGLVRVGTGILAMVVGLALLLAGGRSWLAGVGASDQGTSTNVVGEQGMTQVTTTQRFIVVLNVVPPERMLTAEQARAGGAAQDAELIISGSQGRIGPLTRHTEVHVYDRRTGAAVSDALVRMTLQDQTAGTTTEIPATTMQDLVLGPIDAHYGNNADLPIGHHFLLTAQIDADEATFSGTLR